MIKIQLTRNKVFRWYNSENIYVKGYLFSSDNKLYKDIDLIAYFVDITTEEEFNKKLLSANGCFSVIIKYNDLLWCAVDRLRQFPLFYYIDTNNNLNISDEIEDLCALQEYPKIDSDAYMTFSGFGYVLKNKTLLKDIFQIQAGEYIVYQDERIKSQFYYEYFSTVKNISFEDAKIQLKRIFQNIAQRMARLIEDRPVILPLSGGLDSRLIAYMLKKEGIPHVLCYTFGKKEGNPEWKRSKDVAEKLGYQWIFIDYEQIHNPDFYKEKQFIDFYNYESQCVSKFGFMQYFAVDYLINKLNVDPNSIVLPGHGGDFFAGSHLRPYMLNYKSVSTIAKDLQYIHCSLTKRNSIERTRIFEIIKAELKNVSPLFQNFENWSMKERWVKYITNSTKLFEFFDLETLLPLCDTEFMDFSRSLPFDYRINKKLYKTVVFELFEEFSINYREDMVIKQRNRTQQLKVLIKRTFPFLRKKPNLFEYDYFDFERFSQPIIQELKDKKQFDKIISLNGILSEWYLIQTEKKIKQLNEKN